MIKLQCFLQNMLMQVKFGNLRDVFPPENMENIDCSLNKKFPGTETKFERWDIFLAG